MKQIRGTQRDTEIAQSSTEGKTTFFSVNLCVISVELCVPLTCFLHKALCHQ